MKSFEEVLAPVKDLAQVLSRREIEVIRASGGNLPR